MADAILRIKTVMDIGDAASNIGALQKALSKLKLPDNLKDSLSKNITSFYKEYDKYQKKLSEGLKTQGDYNQVEKSLNRLKGLYSEIGKDAAKAIKIDPNALFDLDEGKFKNITSQIEQTLKKLNDLKIDKKPFEDAKKEIEGLSKNQKIVGDKGILSRMMGHIETGEISKARQEYNNLINEVKKAAPIFDEAGNRISKPGTFNVTHYEQLQGILSRLGVAFKSAGDGARPLEEELDRLQKEMAETITAASKDLIGNVNDYNKEAQGVERVTESLRRMHEQEYNFNRQAQDIDRQIQSWFGLSQMIRKVGDIARDAFQTVKELDAAMVETAVVTNFDVGDMWDMLPTYTANANELGSTIKDVYEAATLYYQQGLNTSQSMGLANETLKMARIGGLQAAEATNMMTAALRGFNMEINQVSAKRINDVYSELAAITAADTKEIGSAMERTASIANSANMEFETTSAFLAQMIETTREAPENLGTAMKTIVARFQEMKQDPTKLVDSEGEAMDVNKIDTALKTVGIDLTNAKGEFRDLDDVFLDISAKWDSMTQGQQRYIATIAAGSRQQSRFIAMMQNHERVMELVDAANNSAGASQKQFEKTLDSMSSKLNKLKNAWDQFTMGLMNNQILKGGVDALTKLFTIVNKIFDFLTKKIPDPFGGLTKSAMTLVSTLAMLNFGKKGARGAVMAGVGWWKNEGKITENFKAGWGVGTKREKKPTESKTRDRIYEEQLSKRLTKAAKEQVVNVPITINPQIKEDYLAKIEASNLSEEVKAKIQEELKGPFTVETQANINTIIAENTGNVEDRKDLLLTSDMLEGGEQAERLGGKFGTLTEKISNAGSQLQAFGETLQGTPLEPFGNVLSTMGYLLMSFGSSLEAVAKSFKINIASTLEDAAAKDLNTAATIRLMWAQLGAAGTAKALGAALWTSLGPFVIIAAVIGAAVAAYKLLDAAIVSDKEKLEAASDAAAKASEAFDSAKQETSELTDAIARIEESDKAFDNLVVGTAEFNEQLMTANEQITQLLQKYPMLNDPKYLSTDKNGLMHISGEGLKAVKEYQKTLQAEASAMNIIQTADLNALENLQKAQDLRDEANKISTDADVRSKNFEDADLLEKRAEIEVQTARQNAIRTALSQQELSNAEAISSIYAGMYEDRRSAAEAEVNALDKQEILQRYADYHGYTYNKSTKKMKDTEGNEVEYEDEYKEGVITDEVIEQTVILDFEENASSLNTVLNKLDDAFSETLEGAFDDSSHFISDLLSSNIETNTDLLDEILSGQSSDLQEAVNQLNEAEVAAILGVSESDVEGKLGQYRKQVVDTLTDKAQNIADAQYESFSELATMMAQTETGSIESASAEATYTRIRGEIRDLTAKQANLLSSTGQLLRDNVGPEAMKTFIGEASKIYLDKDIEKGTKDLLSGFIEDINWESPTGRLAGYKEMIDSTNESVKAFGESMLTSIDEANLLGESFDEFVSSDWEELAENADNFQNSLGQIDAAGIMAAAEESKTLKMLLDSGEVSASAVASALQGIQDGKYSVGEVNTTVLKLLSSLNKLKDVALESHNIIENFDPGIDYGEAEDFAKESAEKVKEYMKNNEWGNEQLQSYIKFFAGQDKWNETLQKYNGDFKKTTQELDGYVTAFSNGITPVYDKLTTGKGLNGKDVADNIQKAVDDKKITKALANKFNDVEIYKDKNGFIQFDFGDLTTDEFEQYLQIAGDMGDNAAKILMEHLADYAETEMSELSSNDLEAYIHSKAFKNARGTSATGEKIEGAQTLTDADFAIIEAAEGGAEAMEKLAREFGYVEEAGGDVTQAIENMKKDALHILTDENGKELSGKEVLRNWDKVAGTKEGRIDSLLKSEAYQDDYGRFDLGKLTSSLQAWGIKGDKAKEATWEAYQKQQQLNEKNGTNDQLSVNGEKIENGLQSMDELWEKINDPDAGKWQDVGKAIAEGIVAYMEGKNTTEDKPADSQKPDSNKPDSSGKPGSSDKSKDTKGFNLVEWIEKHTGKGDADKLSSEKQSDTLEKLYGSMDKNTAEVGGGLKALAAFFSKTGNGTNKNTSPTTGGVPKNKGGGTTGGSSGEGSNKGKSKGRTQETTQNLAIIYNGTIANAQELQTQLQTKLKEILDAVGAQQYTIKAKATVSTTGGKQTTKTSNKGGNKGGTKQTNTITTKTTGQSSVTTLASAFKALKNKTVKVAAKVTGAAKVTALNREINKLKNKSITITTHKKTVKDGGGGAKGINNYIPYHPLPSLGSMAKGRFGRLGPRGKGGLTLTGEKGYEIAWLPNESRSMILGAKGPQMVNLPKDAVVYTHEQSKDILKKKQTIDAGSHSGMSPGGTATGIRRIKKKKGSGSTGSSGSGSKKKKKESINNWSIEEAVRFNLDLEFTQTTEEITKRTKEIEKITSKIVTRYKDIVDLTKDQIKALGEVKKHNQDTIDSYQRQIDDYYSQQAIVSWTNSKGKSKQTKFNIMDYITEEGEINQEALEKISSRAEREAIFKEVSSMKALIEGVQKARQEIENADEQMAELGKKVSEAFYQWENELTEVYHLTQRINDETSFTKRFTSQIELELAKVGVGFESAEDALTNINKVLIRNNDTIQKQIADQAQMIEARKEELKWAISAQDELDNLNRFKNMTGVDDATKQANIDWAQQQYDVAKTALNYVKNVFTDLDGSVQYDIDWEKFNKDNALNSTNRVNKESYEAIKKYLDDLNTKATEFNNSISDATDYIKEQYEALKEYQEKIVSVEDELIKGVEEQTEKETENIQKLSDSVTNALKDLLDEVKRKLDERRKQEDNAKTERDISQKQQRLAALRADTAGGHQVEIAQLEREIADAQQSYTRTLEDQLLDRLQTQADEAAKQRERQIELQETANEIGGSTNKLLVDMWLANPTAEGTKEAMKAAWLEAQGYDEKGVAGQYALEQEFEVLYTELVTAVQQTGFTDDAKTTFKDLETNSKNLVNVLQDLNNNGIELKVTEHNTESVQTKGYTKDKAGATQAHKDDVKAETMKQLGFNAKTLASGGYTAKELKSAFSLKEILNAGIKDVGKLKEAGFTAAQLKKEGYTDAAKLKAAGYTAKNLKDAKFTLKQLKVANYNETNLHDAGYTAKEMKEAGFLNIKKLEAGGYKLNELKGVFSAQEFADNGYSFEKAKELFGLKALKGIEKYATKVNEELAGIKTTYNQFLVDRGAKKKKSSKDQKNWGKLTGDDVKKQVERGDLLGKTPYDVYKDLASTKKLNHKIVMTAFRSAGYTGKEVKSWNPNAKKKSGFRKAFVKLYGKWEKFAQGGLANYTGPAWLDGTPSKPELVLDANDTKNFLALRDVLDKAVNSTNTVQNSYGGNATYEININVDHINNDYDVDRMAERIKKDIVKSAGYRNVAQVRNFR